jgi:hypothetical protein
MKSMKMRHTRQAACMAEKGKATTQKKIHYEDLSVHKWEDSILKRLREMGHKGVDWIYLVQNMDKLQALVNMMTQCSRVVFKLIVTELVKKFSC